MTASSLNLFFLFLWPVQITALQDPPVQAPPDRTSQERLIGLMHQYASQYVSGLPNFLCKQVTREFSAGTKSDRFRTGDTLVSRLSFHDGREQRTIESVNGKAVKPGARRRPSPLTTEGEFGSLLNQILGKDSGATFTWNRWDTLRGKELAVFDFNVDEQHSTLSLQLSDLARATLPYSGSLYADRETGAIWKISNVVSDIPRALQTQEFSTVVDYGEISLGGKSYILPLQAEVNALFSDKKVRNHMNFAEYRKFEADAVVTFGPDK